MSCNSLSLSSSIVATTTKHVSKEYNNPPRSLSGKDLCNRAKMQSFGNSIKQIHASPYQPKLRNNCKVGIFNFQFLGSIIPNSLRSFLFNPKTSKDMNIEKTSLWSDESEEMEMEKEEERANWDKRNVEIRSHWREKQEKYNAEDDGERGDGCGEDGCEVNYGDEEGEEKMSIDRESFSSMLVHISWSDTKLFSKMAFLCNMAYVISNIKAKDLRRHYGLYFVTSSLEKKAEAATLKSKLGQDSSPTPMATSEATMSEKVENTEEVNKVNSHGSANLVNDEEASPRVYKSEVATRIVQSLHSSPCEWFVCDDSNMYTRCFVIQGLDSFASWQAHLLFEPTKFEGTEVLVHRGIYETAQVIYEQFLPEIMDHVNRFGDQAKLQFTGHCLGGSLSLLVSLMLVARKVIKPCALLPVITFGSPFVFCGGHMILKELGYDENDIHCVMMHRDIFPRAFSCSYPKHVARVLEHLNGSFQSHPCMNKNKSLYSPMGKIFILQPDENSSPPHPLLPPGNALYTFGSTNRGSTKSALKAFLNYPHPLETLSNLTAYGSEGTILRDHDSSNYLKAINQVIRQQHKTVVRKWRKERSLLWPVLTPLNTSG